jgi:hypothetical protein
MPESFLKKSLTFTLSFASVPDAFQSRINNKGGTLCLTWKPE